MTKKHQRIKRLLCLLLSGVMLTGITAGLDLTALAETSGDFEYELLDDGTAEITGYTGEATDLTIPDALDGYTVTSIGDEAFDDCSALENVTIPNGVTYIGEFAFWYCQALKSITIPDSVISIGGAAFSQCSVLENITIPDSVASIGDIAFSKCYALESITVDENNPYYSDMDGVLFNKEQTTLIRYPAGKTQAAYTVPNSVTSIEAWAFSDCSALESIIIPNSITSIGDYAFDSCYAKSITIPDSVTSIGHSAFSDCDALESITIPNSVTSIGQYAFDGCDALENIIVDANNPYYSDIDGVLLDKEQTILIQYPAGKTQTAYTVPNGVISIGSEAFRYCGALESITIPNSVTNIGEYAFYECSVLESVTIADSVTRIGYMAFADCYALKSITIPDGVTSIESATFNGCYALEKITIPDSVTSIENQAFSDCYALKSITIPNSVTNIGDWVFSRCYALESITVDENNQYYSNIDGVLFNKEQTTLIQYPLGNTQTVYTIPNSVTNIEDDAFQYCGALESITIPNSVTSIGNYAFDECSALKSITIPDSVTSIGDSAFSGCDALESITLSNNVTTIGDYAFSHCYALKNITIPNSVTSIGDFVFSRCDALESVTIPDSVTSVGYSAFSGCDVLTDVFYAGSIDQWNAISVGENNECLTYANIHYNTYENHYELVESVEATCTEDGYKKYTCPCGYERVEWDYAHHQEGEVISTTEATCTEDGYTVYKCTVCGEEYKDDWVYAPGHQKGEFVKTVAPTCTSEGYTVYKCTVCGEEYEDDWVSSLGHQKGEVVEIVAPTCTSEGYTVYKCSVCGAEFEDDWTWAEHSYEILVDEHAATCCEDGYIKYKCTTCDDTFIVRTEYALGHTFENDVCTRCGMLKEDCIESEHPYADNEDKTYTLHKPGAQSIAITFSSNTSLEAGLDYIYIYDSEDNLCGMYTGDALASERIVVSGDTIKIRLTSDSSDTRYGFALKKVETDVTQVVTDDSTGITVSEETIGSLPSNSEIGVEQLAASQDSITYNIVLLQNDTVVQPNGAVTVKIPVPSGMDGAACKVYRAETDGSYTDMNAVLQDDYLVFTTDHFSEYVVTTGDPVDEPAPQPGTLGDVDGNGLVNAADAVMVLRSDAGLTTLTAEQSAAADINGDGVVNASDAVQILRYDAGLITQF